MQKAGVLGVSGRSPDASGTGFFAFMICYPVEALKSICVECFTEFPYKDAGRYLLAEGSKRADTRQPDSSPW